MSVDSEKLLTLYTNHLSPNGLKVSIYLEELRARDPSFEYNIFRIDLSKGTHKEPWFIKLNPNGRIPLLVDHTQDDFPVFESAAILLYVEQHFDTKKILSFDIQKQAREYSSMIQWIFFAHGGLSTMQSQAHYFLHYSAEDVPFGKIRYREETKRVYGVLNIGLTDRDWLAGSSRGRYSIADVNVFPWVRLHARAGIEDLEEWPHLKAWLTRMSERKGVETALKNYRERFQQS